MPYFLDIKNRVAFRRIFGTEKNKELLISFLSNIIEFDSSLQMIDVHFLSKSTGLDMLEVLCKFNNGTEMLVAMNMISRESSPKDSPYISQLFDSRSKQQQELLISRHKGALKAIVFMFLCDFPALGEGRRGDYITYYTVDVKKPIKGLPKEFSFVLAELSKFKVQHVEDLTDMLQKWSYIFTCAPTTSREEVNVIAGNDMIIKRVYEELDPRNWSEQELQMYEEANKR